MDEKRLRELADIQLNEGEFEKRIRDIEKWAKFVITNRAGKNKFQKVKNSPRGGITFQDDKFEYSIFLDISGGEK